MRFLVLGATGFSGKHSCAVLLAAGHEVIGAGRRIEPLARAFPGMAVHRLDLTNTSEAEWRAALEGVDVLVNMAGQLNRDLAAVHVEGPARLYRAALAAGVRRVILVSAISARPDVTTAYSATKLAGERALIDSGVTWTVLRPSMIVAKGSFGGSSVLRGLAALPFIAPQIPDGDARFSPIHARDLGEAIRLVAEDERFAATTLEPTGAETLTTNQIIATYRQWLGFPPGRPLNVLRPLLELTAAIGEQVGGPISTTALRQLGAGNEGDPVDFAAKLGWAPRGLSEILRDEPAEVQDRWHARLVFLAIAARLSLIVLWLGSATAGLLNGWMAGWQFAVVLGLPGAAVSPLVSATSLLDIGIAALLLTRHCRLAAIIQLAVVVAYTIGIGLVLPGLWADPFGALLKNLPILVLIVINAVLSEAR